MKTRSLLTLPVLCVGLIMLAGCTFDDDPSPEKARDIFCTEVAELDAAAVRFAAVDSRTGTVADVRRLRTELEQQWRKVQDASKDVTLSGLTELEKAYNKLIMISASVTDAASLAAAEPQFDVAATELNVARSSQNQSIGC